MNIIENYKYLKEITDNEIVFRKLKFHTKDQIDILINKSNLIIIAYDIIEEETNTDDKIKKLSSIIEEMTFEEQKDIISYMIENWLGYSSEVIKKIWFNTDEIHINTFIEWNKNWKQSLFYSDYYLDFINLYKDPKKLMLKIWEEWLITNFGFLKEFFNLEKIKENETKQVMANFEKEVNSLDLLYKFNIFSVYNWDEILEYCFEETETAKKYIKDIFTLKEKEIEEFKILKEEVLNDEYIDEIYEIRNELENNNYQVLKEIEFKKEDNINNKKDKLYKELNKLATAKNHWNKFNIVMTDLTWRKIDFLLTNNMSELRKNENSFLFVNDLIEKFNNKLDDMLYYLEKNNINFTIVISKTNWTKDDNDNQEDNNYQEDIKKAA